MWKWRSGKSRSGENRSGENRSENRIQEQDVEVIDKRGEMKGRRKMIEEDREGDG